MKTSFYIIILLFPVCLFSQNNPKEEMVPGAIITRNFDTIVTYIEKDELSNMQRRVFYLDENKKKTKLDPNESQGFILFKKGGHLYFESRGDYKFAMIKPRKNKTFLFRIFNHPVQLYYYMHSKAVQGGFYNTYDEEPYYLIYKDWLHEWHTINESEFKKGCKKALADDVELLNDINEGKYNFEDMETIIEKYTEFVKLEYPNVFKARGAEY
jgi:hypothetical protein